jgi:hypothetical protein
MLDPLDKCLGTILDVLASLPGQVLSVQIGKVLAR